MERSKIVIGVLVLAAACAIIWWVGLRGAESYLPVPERKAGAQPKSASARSQADGAAQEQASGQDEPNAATNTDTSGEPNEPAGSDANQPASGEPNRPAGSGQPVEGGRGPTEPGASSPSPEAAKPAVPEDPNDPLEAINLKDVEMKNIIEKIAQWTGKTVIPHDEVMKQKITIYAPDKLPRSKALARIYSALRLKNYIAEEEDDTIFLKPIAQARLGIVPTIRADEPLAAIENKDQIVQKFFNLRHYPPAQMGEIIQPLVGDYGHVGADETTSTLLVIDTVSNLMRIERIIAQFDVAEAGKTVTEIIAIEYGDPAEIVQLLRMLLGESPDGRSRGSSRSRSTSMSRPSSPRPSGPPGKDGGGVATSVVIHAGDIPLILIPEPKRKWIIASGSAEDIKKIHEWIDKLDIEEPVRSESETVSLAYADPREVARQIEDALQEMPGTELRPSVLVRPLEQTRQIMIFGRADLRDMVKKLIAEIDMPPGTFETKNFILKHADPEQVKANIDSLYGENANSADRYNYYYWRYAYGQKSPSDTVKAIAFPTMSQVTVIASPENMRKIEKQIDEWDVPLDVEAVKPRIITLENSDPVQMADLLTNLFTEEQDSSRSFMRWLFWDDFGDQKKKIVGPLYGQLTFEEVPGTKKIIVISKIPQAYDVVEQLIYELDRQEMGEIPKVVQLKYADVEDLAERLNAMFNEPGTSAAIRRSARGLADYSMDSEGSNQSSGSRPQSSNSSSNPGEYRPWWSQGARQRPDEQPISNVIGRVRFIPDPRSKSILILAPPQYHDDLQRMIDELDVPGKQVMVKAIILTVDHQDLTSLGIQLATNPLALQLNENALEAVTTLSLLEDVGSVTVDAQTEIRTLVDFLMKTVNAKVLNQQTLWTKDNEEASFFKGEQVAFVVGSTVSPEGRITSQNVDYQKVGMTLAVRPSITPEKNVDMTVSVNLSQLTGELVNGQPLRSSMETETNMIVQDGQTLMLGGMLFQRDSAIVRKIPLLGDLPLLGALFRHYENAQINNELIVFITPYVMGDDAVLSPETASEVAGPRRTLGEVRQELNETAERLEEKLEKK